MPAPPPRMGRDDPTGEARFRRSLFGRLVLQVQLRASCRDSAFGKDRLYWADAVDSDLWRLRWHRQHRKLEALI